MWGLPYTFQFSKIFQDMVSHDLGMWTQWFAMFVPRRITSHGPPIGSTNLFQMTLPVSCGLGGQSRTSTSKRLRADGEAFFRTCEKHVLELCPPSLLLQLLVMLHSWSCCWAAGFWALPANHWTSPEYHWLRSAAHWLSSQCNGEIQSHLMKKLLECPYLSNSDQIETLGSFSSSLSLSLYKILKMEREEVSQERRKWFGSQMHFKPYNCSSGAIDLIHSKDKQMYLLHTLT